MKKINAKIVADSIDNRGNRITSYVLTYPRIIHSELMTHRIFSRNAASSRAIPFAKMIKEIEEDPFIPIAWQKHHKGMQGVEYLHESETEWNVNKWLRARDWAAQSAQVLNNGEVTKQLCNRLLEPFQWMTTLVTATEYDNFFELRAPKYTYSTYQGDCEEPIETRTYKSWKDVCSGEIAQEKCGQIEKLECNKSQAEIHIQALAEAMWDARNESAPKELKAGEWHIPFGDKIDDLNSTSDKSPIELLAKEINKTSMAYSEDIEDLSLKIATARCARLSYMTFDNEIDYKKDISLHDILLESKHMSPFEHCARVMTDEEYFSYYKGEHPIGKENDGELFNYEIYPKLSKPKIKTNYGWCNNFKGFIQYRFLADRDS